MVDDKKIIKLLMVDDEEDFLASSSKALSRRGFEVEVARDGQTALEILQQQKFEVVLLDVKMPGLDGVEVFHRIQKNWPDLPVVMLTGHGSIAQAFQTSKEGVYDYLSKPCDMDDLAERLHGVTVKAKNLSDNKSKKQMDQEPPEPIQVLLVDDEVELLETLKNVLGRRKIEVTIAQSGEEALEILKETFIDVVVLDVKMPGMGGLEALQIIKKDYPIMEVLLLTGHPTVEIAMDGVKLGASEYIVKPPQIEALADSIRRAYWHRQENIAKQQKKTINDIRKQYPD